MNCFFKREMYSADVQVLAVQDGVVFVEGWTKEDPDTGNVTEIDVTDFRLAPAFALEDYRNALGSLPDYTGQHSTMGAWDDVRDSGFVLQSQTTLGASPWIPVATNPPNNQITLGISNSARYIRLQPQ